MLYNIESMLFSSSN